MDSLKERDGVCLGGVVVVIQEGRWRCRCGLIHNSISDFLTHYDRTLASRQRLQNNNFCKYPSLLGSIASPSEHFCDASFQIFLVRFWCEGVARCNQLQSALCFVTVVLTPPRMALSSENARHQ